MYPIYLITPELEIKWECFNIPIGYNIPTSVYLDNCTNLFKSTFSFNFFSITFGHENCV